MADLMTQVARLDRHLETRTEIMAFFKREYKGVTRLRNGRTIETWKKELIDALQPFTKGKTGQPQSRESVARRFQGGRENSKLKPKAIEEYKALGKKLPAQPPLRGYAIRGTVCIQFGDYPCEERTWAHKVVNENKWNLFRTGSLQGLINIYMGQLWEDPEPEMVPCEKDDEEEESEEDCNTKLKITALTERQEKRLPNLDGSH